jgi:hypothetical protein
MRKLLMLAAMALAAMALAGVSATTAAADVPFEVLDPNWGGEPCGEVSESAGVVEGGCLVEDFDGRFDLYSGTTPINYYNTRFDLVVDADGTGYAVEPVIYGQGPGLVRVACYDGPNSDPWPVQIRALGGGEFEIDMTMCITTWSGGSNSYRAVTLEVSQASSQIHLTQTEDDLYIRNGHWATYNDFFWIETEE